MFICTGITLSIAVDTVNIEHANGKSSNDDIDWWPMFHHDLQHSGFSTSNAPDTNNVLWTYITEGPVQSSPAIVDDKVYFGSDSYYGDNVHCLDAYTGEYIWGYHTGYFVSSSPAVADGKVYIGSDDDNVYCLDAETGDFIWSYTTGHNPQSSPAVADSKVYIGANDGYVYCLDANTGDYIWSYHTGSSGDSSPAVVNGKVYIGSHDNKVYCLDADNGDFIWSYTTGGWMSSSSPAVVDGKVYIGSDYDEGTMYCFDANTGDLIWSYPIVKMTMFSSPAVANGKVYIGGGRRKFFCFGAPSQPPDAPNINGPTSGKPGQEYEYTFNSTDPDGDTVRYYVNWGDDDVGWTEYSDSGVEITLKHAWSKDGTYNITAKAQDIYGLNSSEGTLTVEIPRNRARVNSLFQLLYNSFPLLEVFLRAMNLLR